MALISPETLLARVRAADARLRICDVRWYLGKPGAGRAAYDEAHLPGAIFVDLDRDLAGPGGGRHPLPDPAAFARRMGGLGIGREHSVVAYDDVGGGVAARLWWMLDDLGHPDVAVLDGGLPAWVAAGGELTTAASSWPPTTLDLRGRWSRTIDRETLRSRLGEVTLLDARAGERYRGEIEPVDPVAGHIPTARSVPATANLGPDGRFLPADRLRARFGESGAAGGSEVVTYCGSGVNATQNALAMRVAGLPDPILYPGSYSDWSTAGERVATGPEPGRPDPVAERRDRLT
jgi:thiosulfate/3-mercaptopyruvate sulfurtransferase